MILEKHTDLMGFAGRRGLLLLDFHYNSLKLKKQFFRKWMPVWNPLRGKEMPIGRCPEAMFFLSVSINFVA